MSTDDELETLRARVTELESSMEDWANMYETALAERDAARQQVERLREALGGLLDVMDIQEKRRSGEFHLSVEAFTPLWREAKDRARAALAVSGATGTGAGACTCASVKSPLCDFCQGQRYAW